MLGTFDLPIIGRFVVSGDTPEAFLWDLFDQVALGANLVTKMGSATVIVPGKDPGIDAGERREAHGSPEWCRGHSDYFVGKIAGGCLLFSLDLPQELFFGLHCTGLLGAVMNETPGGDDWQLQSTILGYMHGFGSPEQQAALGAVPAHDFDVERLTAESLINYMIRKGVLSLNESAGPSFPGIMSMADARAAMAARKAETARLKEELMRVARESRERARQRKPRRSPSP